MPNPDALDRPETSPLESAATQAECAAQAADPPLPKNITSLQRSKRPTREWFARVRIREDRLARLWVSNLVGHDVLVWSKKERRWVALLAVAELRRALEGAGQDVPMGSRRPPPSGAKSARHPPESLPPVPPLASMHAAAAGIGELRLRSIAQGKGSFIGAGIPRELQRSPFAALLPPRGLPASASAFRKRRQTTRHDQRLPLRPRRWHWRALERATWVAAGVVGMFVVSSAGSTDERAAREQAIAILLSADRPDPHVDNTGAVRHLPTPGELLIGLPQQCLERPVPNAPISTVTESEPPFEEPSRNVATQPRLRTTAGVAPRPHNVAEERPSRETYATEAEVPTDLNFPAIRAALFNAAALARACPGENISGKTVVTFDTNGTVRTVEIPLLVGERPDRRCIVHAFKLVRVPPFSGRPVAVKKDF